MYDKIIWNDNCTMCFSCWQFSAARIKFPDCPAAKEKHWVMVYLKGTPRLVGGDYSHDVGFYYKNCTDLEAAKDSLAELVRKVETAKIECIAQQQST